MRLFVILVTLVALGEHATAGKSKKLACRGWKSCVKKCTAKNTAACDRLFDLLEPELESLRPTPGSVDPAVSDMRKNLPAVCKAKHHKSCVLLGELEELGIGGAADKAGAEARFVKACKAGVSHGCVALGRAQAAGTLEGGQALEAARETYDDACDRGMQDACGRLGYLVLELSGGKSEDVTRGVERLEQACGKKSAWSCAALGYAYQQGIQVKADPGAAAKFYRKGCKHRDLLSCQLLTGTAPFDADETKLLDADCDAGHASSCVAIDADERACAAGDLESCRALKWALTDDGKRAVADADRDTYEQYLAILCEDGGLEYDCEDYAAYDLPRYVPESPWDPDLKAFVPPATPPPSKKRIKRATKLLETFCDRGQAPSCDRLADLYSQEYFGVVDAERAKDVLARLCKGPSVSYRCSTSKKLAVEQNLADVTDHAACERGDLDACARYGSGEWDYQHLRTPALEKVCASGRSAACVRVAKRKYAKDPTTDISPVVTACEADDRDACGWLAFEPKLDPRVSTRGAERACQLGNAYDCYTFGERTLEGVGTTADVDAAIAAFERACELDDRSTGCTRASELRAEKLTRDQNAACDRGDGPSCLALGYVEKACELGQADGCERAAESTGDQGRQEQYLQRACELGRSGACDRVAALRAPPPESEPAVVTPAPPPYRPSATKRTLLPGARGRIDLGYLGLSSDELPRHGGVTAGLTVRSDSGGRLAATALLRGRFDHDSMHGTGYDVGFGLGARYGVGALRVRAVGVVGRDEVGAGGEPNPTRIGAPASWYYGGELGAQVHLGPWSVDAAYQLLERSDGDERRLEVSLEHRRPRGRSYGVGVRQTKLALPAWPDAEQLSVFGLVAW